MPNWKKVITSGSNAHLNQITASGEIFATGDIESDGTIIGDGLNINGTTTFNDGNITNVGDITLDSISDDEIEKINNLWKDSHSELLDQPFSNSATKPTPK